MSGEQFPARKIPAGVLRLRVVRDDSMLMIGGTYPGSTVDLPRCACPAQAHYTATRGGRKPVTSVELVDHAGNVIPRDEWPACRMTPGVWPWEHHAFTHQLAVP